jgi:hypothetical protein
MRANSAFGNFLDLARPSKEVIMATDNGVVYKV